MLKSNTYCWWLKIWGKRSKKLEQIISFFFPTTPATTASLEKGERNTKNIILTYILSVPFQIFLSILHRRELKSVFIKGHYIKLHLLLHFYIESKLGWMIIYSPDFWITSFFSIFCGWLVFFFLMEIRKL